MRIVGFLLVSLALSSTAASDGGTVFLEGEDVRVPIPAMQEGGVWRALDDQLNEAAVGAWSAADGMITLGTLPAGWYRIEFLDETSTTVAFTTAAVLSPLAAPPPADTPVAVDVAMSWVPESDPAVWNLCAHLAKMAGITMVRDRLRWRDIQPEREATLLDDTVYDQTANLQQEQGLQVLQVFHGTPEWAWTQERSRGRVPDDLRDTWRFCRDVAAHFAGRVQAWQPWNEGNAGNFGGHTIDELCSHQKAAYLGFRTSNPDVVVSWAPLGGINAAALTHGISANGAAAYFDVYAMHSYDWAHDYPRLRQHALEAASGKPLWVTECDRGMQADPDSPHGDLTHENERRKAEFIVQSYASSLAAGATRHFHFILSQYMEQNNTIQFGLLRHDYTPRMGYVALAATGRLLAGAQYLGRLEDAARPDVYVFAFRALPDGAARDVLVAWTEAPLDWPERGRAVAAVSLPTCLPVVDLWDYLGRKVGETVPSQLTSAPIFIVLREGAANSLRLTKPTPVTAPSQEKPSPVVLQLRAPDIPIKGRVVEWAHLHDRIMGPGDHEVTIAAYHFGEGATTGAIKATELPTGWRCEPDTWDVSLEPMQRHDQQVYLHIPEPGAPEPDGAWLHFEGDFGAAGKPRLAFRVMPE